MKKSVAIIIVVMIVGGVLLFYSFNPVFKKGSEVVNPGTSSAGGELLGPGGCESVEECKKYCADNEFECVRFCEENPEQCPDESKRHDSGFEGLGLINKLFSGPGGCSGPDCEEYCSQNFQECAKWCEENPTFCGAFFKGTKDRVSSPDSIISFQKSFNLIGGPNKEDIMKAKELGANMVTLWPTRMIVNDEVIFFPDKDGFGELINIAHENGLQVELRSSFNEGEQPQNYAVWKDNVLKHVEVYAKYGEDHGVSRIIPFAEIDNFLTGHNDKVNEIAEETLAIMRKHYSGDIGVGIQNIWKDEKYAIEGGNSRYDFSGYDYMSLSAYTSPDFPYDDFFKAGTVYNFAKILKWAEHVKDKSNINTLKIGETGVYNVGEQEEALGIGNFFYTYEVSEEEEANFYRNLFQQSFGRVQGISIVFGDTVVSVKGQDAELVVKENFAGGHG